MQEKWSMENVSTLKMITLQLLRKCIMLWIIYQIAKTANDNFAYSIGLGWSKIIYQWIQGIRGYIYNLNIWWVIAT